MSNRTEDATWPDLAASLYDRLTGRGAEITYGFEDVEVAVPSYAGADATAIPWRVNGTVRISTRDRELS